MSSAPHEGASLPDREAVVEMLAGYLATPLGRAELERMAFIREPDELERRHRLLSQARLWLRERGSFSFSGFEGAGDDPRDAIARARLPGASLEAADFMLLQRFTSAAAGLRDHVVTDSHDWPELAAAGAGIPDLSRLRQRLEQCFLPDGSLDDRASPALARLRRQREKQRQEIERSLKRELQRLGSEGALQDELVTVRHDRYVLPVRTDLRRRAPGVLHGASSSGQTVFVEPLATIELNNEHIRLLDMEQAEISRILQELTAMVGEEADALEAATAAWGKLEFESAKARFGFDYGATDVAFGPEANDTGSGPQVFELRDARHPVLVKTLGKRVVPLSLKLQEQRLLIISGPNTGGKTVVLKTIGMAAWMAQCGLPVCASYARLPVFGGIWADVGDVQSLQQNLSTFSSHLVHIRDILAAADEATLVLLDELGTATNAAEGAALATAIADELRQRHVWTVISTHHDSLKAWASAHPADVANGSVALDPDTLQPNYLFRMGVPGISAGLQMAERLGLPAALVAAARSRLSRTEAESAEYLERLQRNLAETQARLEDLRRRETAIGDRERGLAERERGDRRQEAAAIRREAERRLEKLASALEAEWRRAAESLKAEFSDQRQRRKIEVANARLKRETGEVIKAGIAEALQAAGPSPSSAEEGADVGAEVGPPDPQPGDQIRLRSLQTVATVLRRQDESLEIMAGNLRMQVKLEEVATVIRATKVEAPSPPAARKPNAPPPASRGSAPPVTGAMPELNLIGMRAEEAGDRLERFLDEATAQEAERVRIVHGAGFGVLRKVVAERLRGNPLIERYYHPAQSEGGQGVTIAEFKL